MRLKCYELVAKTVKTISYHRPPKQGSTKVLELLTSLTQPPMMSAPPRAGPHEIIHELSIKSISSTSTDRSTLCDFLFPSHSFSLSTINIPSFFTAPRVWSYSLSLLSVDAV